MDSSVRWQGFDAQVAVDWLLRTPEQMPPKIQPLNNPKTQPQRQSGSWIVENYGRTGRAPFISKLQASDALEVAECDKTGQNATLFKAIYQIIAVLIVHGLS